jgi:hypothetical protein
MVRIVQTQLAARIFKLLRRDSFQRSLRSYRHENWEWDGAMWEVQCGRARFCCAAF